MKRISINLFLILFSVQITYAQTNERLIQDFLENRKNRLSEKVFLELDKEVLKTGDSLNYTAFTFDLDEEKEFNPSKFLSVNLVTNTGSLVSHQRLIIEDGIAFGNFTITEKIPPGKYIIIAYSELMEGLIDRYFYKGIIIEGIQNSDSEKNKVILEAFAEGNQLVKNLSNHIIIKSTSKTGEGIPYSGMLVNSKLEEIGTFQTNQEGFCKIPFKPSNNEKYYLSGNNSNQVEIPNIQDSGMVLRLVNQQRLKKI